MSDLFVDNIKHQSSQGSGTITLGASGEKITTASGAEFSNITGQNYPAFHAYLSSEQTGLSTNTFTKVEFDTEDFDTDNTYDNSTNYRFTPTVAGKYFCYYNVRISFSAGSPEDIRAAFKKNGVGSDSITDHIFKDYSSENPAFMYTISQSTIFDFNGSTDYLEVFARSDASSPTIPSGSNFGAYRIGA